MRVHLFLPVAFLAIFGLVADSGEERASVPDRKAERPDFSGTWKLNEKLSTDPFDRIRKDVLSSSGGDRGSPGGGSGDVGAIDIPFEALEIDPQLVVVDDGEKVRITRAHGRQRVLFTDGEERELDEGDGPAKVVAKRKGGRGERIVVSSKWARNRDVQETWEILSNPRRLAVTTAFRGRRSFTTKRIYEPAPEGPPEPASTPAAAVAPAAMTPTAVVPAAKPECSTHPPKGATQAELSRMVRITQADAEARAIASVAPRTPSSVISSDVEVVAGCLVWTFDLRFSDKRGVQEVAVDAGDGKVLSSEFEPPTTQETGKEKDEDGSTPR